MNSFCQKLFISWYCLALVSGVSIHAQDNPDRLTVLVLYDTWNVGYWEDQFTRNLTDHLRAEPDINLEISYEFPGLGLVPEGEEPSEVIDYLKYRQALNPVDVVIAVLPVANTFLLEYGEEIFPGIPAIFVLPSGEDTPAILALPRSVVIESASGQAIQNTLNSIPELLPDTERIYIVAGSGAGDIAYLARGEVAATNVTFTDIEINYLTGLTFLELSEQVRTMPEHSAILFLTMDEDADGNTFSTADVVDSLSEVSNAPIFGFFDTVLDFGIVGGNVTGSQLYGETVANAVLDIHMGTPGSDNILIPGNTAYIYDWRELQRWHIPEDRLPENSLVQNKTLSFFEANRNAIIAAVVVIVIQMMFIIALIIVLRQRRLAAQDAIKRETEFRAIFENSRDAISVSSNGVIVMVNKAFLNMFGYAAAAEMIGKPVGSNLMPEEQTRVQQYSRNRDLSDDIPRMYEARACTRSGEEFDLETRVASYDLNGVIFNVAILRNISDRKRMETLTREAEVLQTELDKEKKLLELRERFISFLSHEFRQPLAIIQTSLDLLVRYHDRLSQERRSESHEKIGTQIIRLNEMIDSTLNLLRSQSENLSFAPIATDLGRLCEDIVEQVKLTDKKAHQFNFSSALTEQALMIDVAILKHILINLLGNAVKYSPDESPIYLDLSHSDDTIHISVRDEGIGIPPDDQEKLFETFHRASNVGKRDGTGLGLSIVQQYVTLHGGTIEFESELDKGSKFTVILPFVSASESSKSAV